MYDRIKILKLVLLLFLLLLFSPIVFATNGASIEGRRGDSSLTFKIGDENFKIEIIVVDPREEETGVAQEKREKIYDAFVSSPTENKITTWIQEIPEIRELILKALKKCDGLEIYVHNNNTTFWYGEADVDKCHLAFDLHDLEDIVKNKKGTEKAIGQIALHYVMLHEILHLAGLKDDNKWLTQKEIDPLKNEIGGLNGSIKSLENEIAQKEKEAKKIEDDKKQVDELPDLRKQLKGARTPELVLEINRLLALKRQMENENKDSQLQELKDQITNLKNEIQSLTEALTKSEKELTDVYVPFQGKTVETVNIVQTIPRNTYQREKDGRIYFGVKGDYLDRAKSDQQTQVTTGGPETSNYSGFCAITGTSCPSTPTPKCDPSNPPSEEHTHSHYPLPGHSAPPPGLDPSQPYEHSHTHAHCPDDFTIDVHHTSVIPPPAESRITAKKIIFGRRRLDAPTEKDDISPPPSSRQDITQMMGAFKDAVRRVDKIDSNQLPTPDDINAIHNALNLNLKVWQLLKNKARLSN